MRRKQPWIPKHYPQIPPNNGNPYALPARPRPEAARGEYAGLCAAVIWLLRLREEQVCARADALEWLEREGRALGLFDGEPIPKGVIMLGARGYSPRAHGIGRAT